MLIFIKPQKNNFSFIKHVPIPLASFKCRAGCCTVTFVPLSIAFARTLHQFQGQEAGKDKRFKCIVCDPGNRTFETINIGTAYTALSRASDLGDENGKESAIYFTGPNVNVERLTNITSKQSSSIKKEKYKNVLLRDRWISHLQSNLIQKEYSKKDMRDLKHWYDQTTLDIDTFDSIYIFHKNNR